MTDAVGPIVAFDFDGTLTRRDSLAPYLKHLLGPVALASVVARHSIALALVAAGRGDRDRTKAAFLHDALAGVSRHRIELAAAQRADRTLARGMRRDTPARLRWHRAAGHHVVVVSASPEFVVAPVASALGAHEVLATQLEFADDRCTGHLIGANVRGPEKVRRLRERFGPDVALTWAYGDSAGDDDMLELAEHAISVRNVTVPVAPR